MDKKNPALSYPSPADVRVFIGDIWVDDLYRIDFSVNNPRTPLYDYTSTYFKDVVEGTTIVQGQLVINYRYPGYLLYAINNRKVIPQPGQEYGLDGLRIKNTPNYKVKDSSEIFRDIANGSDQQKMLKLIGYKKLGALDNVKQVAAALVGQQTLNGIEQGEVLTHKTKMPFDITITYGINDIFYRKIIKNCYIIGESEVISAAAVAGGDLSSSGMPILEVYSFFGKKVLEEVTDHSVNQLNK